MWTLFVHKKYFIYLWTQIDHSMKWQSFTSFGEYIRTLLVAIFRLTTGSKKFMS